MQPKKMKLKNNLIHNSIKKYSLQQHVYTIVLKNKTRNKFNKNIKILYTEKYKTLLYGIKNI